MTDIDTEMPVSTRPPILVIVMGFVHAVGGGVAAVLFSVGFGLNILFAGQRSFRSGSLSSTVAGFISLETLTLLAVIGFLAAAFLSGLWLLRMEQRGRRLTIALACIAFLFQGTYMVKSILSSGKFARMHFLKAVAVYWGELGVMAYCLFVLVVMYLPSVRRFYAPTGHASAATKSV